VEKPVETSPKLVKPHQLGWLRRPDLDKTGYEVWELPDGRLHYHPCGTTLILRISDA